MKRFFVYLNIIRFWPHWICYMLSKGRNLINKDLNAYRNEYAIRGSNFYLLFHLLFFNRSFRSLFYFRIGKIKWSVQWIAPGMHYLAFRKNMPVGGGLLLFHAYGTVLNAKQIGCNCRVIHNVTIGEKKGGRPAIGDRVEILANAVIVGNITIGNDCVIGPGAVVYKSVPDHCVVVGNPAIILKENGIIVRRKL